MGTVLVDAASNPPRYWNSVVLIDHDAKLLSRYDKQHLVPFGEYVPLSDYLPIDKIVPGFGAFESGNGTRILPVNHYMIMHPLICYEIIFPDYATSYDRVGRDVIINLTNDDWFGYSFGPFQHLMMARFRAVEQGVPVIRVANSGISAVIDAYGRIQHELPLHEEGTIEVE